MAVALKKLSHNQLTAGAVTQYTVPALTTTRVMSMLITNDATADRTVTVHFVPSGGSVLAANKVLAEMSIAAKTTVEVQLAATMSTGDFISALASATTSINLYISGAEIT